MTSSDSATRYFQSRFGYDAARAGVWRAIVGFLNPYFPSPGSVLELGAGYCAFINAVPAAERHALDLFESFPQYAAPGVQTHVQGCEDLSIFPDRHFDVVFASNLFEHLTHETLATTMGEVRRVLKPGGRLILMQPNYRYCYREYFDDYTHRLVFSHVSLADLMVAHGLTVERVIPRFLPFSLSSRAPKWPWLVSLYLRLPWRPTAKQMLIVGRA
jgi:SAM-dependent methyltransferase